MKHNILNPIQLSIDLKKIKLDVANGSRIREGITFGTNYWTQCRMCVGVVLQIIITDEKS
jgi:hypothetical protein